MASVFLLQVGLCLSLHLSVDITIVSTFCFQEKIENALAAFDKVVDIWYKFLLNLRAHPTEHISDYLGEAQIGETTEMLRKILETRSRFLGAEHIATGEVRAPFFT